MRDKISREVYDRRKAEVGGDRANPASFASLAGNDSEDEDLIGYDAIEPGLPPASSDRQKWWLDNGKMAKSSISPPKPDNAASQMILNPKRPTNPHVPTDEPDWVSVPRSESRLSSFSSMSTSPYEHVNHSMLLSSSASSSVPRKLPPPYDASALPAKVGRLHLNEDSRSSPGEGAPPPPPPRRQTGLASSPANKAPAPAAQQKRRPVNTPAATAPPPVGPKPAAAPPQAQPPPAKQKSAPPVARKPAHLTAPVSPVGSISPSFTSDSTMHIPDPSLPSLTDTNPRRSNPSVNGSRADLAENLSSILQRNNSSGGGLRSSAEPAPPPQPPRRTNTAGSGVPTQSRLAAAGGIPLVGLAAVGEKERRPVLPGRKPTGSGSGAGPVSAPPVVAQKKVPPPPAARRPAPQAAVVDLLGDEGGMEMGGWEALKPT